MAAPLALSRVVVAAASPYAGNLRRLHCLVVQLLMFDAVEIFIWTGMLAARVCHAYLSDAWKHLTKLRCNKSRLASHLSPPRNPPMLRLSDSATDGCRCGLIGLV